VPVLPPAEPFHSDGGRTGVLLIHGFTGSPVSMKPWGHHLANEGFTVDVPRLPGHGTTWQELNQTTWNDWYAEASCALDSLHESCAEVFVGGLSMGGCLALRLAADRPDDVSGLLLVNPSVASVNKQLFAVPVLKRVLGSVSGIGNDIKKPGVDEFGYKRTPLKALDSLRAMWRLTRDDLPKVTAPVLLFRSVEDHVVEPLSAQLIVQRVSSRDIIERVLDNSYHVATLDNDAESIFDESAEFIRKHSSVDDDNSSGTPGHDDANPGARDAH
jgi:carboxylesterase